MTDDLDGLLEEQQRYYALRAPRYWDGALTQFQTIDLERALAAAVDEHCRGDVLELACGPGTWTPMLAARARALTAVDGSPEMLQLARAATQGRDNLRFVEVDIFDWEPDRCYDAVFFGFWLSHVPEERFEAFWATVARCLLPGGHVLFVDDGHRTPDEEEPFGAAADVVVRTLHDGSRHRIVKVRHTAAELKARLAALGWSVHTEQIGPFYWGCGARRTG